MFGRAGKSSCPQKSLLAELTRLANFDEEATALTGRARLSKGGARTLACRARSAKERSPQASAHDGEDSRTVAGRDSKTVTGDATAESILPSWSIAAQAATPRPSSGSGPPAPQGCSTSYKPTATIDTAMMRKVC